MKSRVLVVLLVLLSLGTGLHAQLQREATLLQDCSHPSAELSLSGDQYVDHS